MIVDRRRIIRTQHQRQPKTRSIWMAKSLWHNADDCARSAIDRERAAEHVGPRVQGVAPKIVANDRDRTCSFTAFLFAEGAATRRCQAKHIEEIPSDLRRRNSLSGRAVI